METKDRVTGMGERKIDRCGRKRERERQREKERKIEI